MKTPFKKISLLVLFLVITINSSLAQQKQKEELLFGVAYYDEYMPYDRLDQDIKMMKEAGINCVRIAESTWSTVEPQDNVFDFKHIDRVLDAMYKANIKVIIGTPTYAVPTWLVKKYPSVLATTPKGQNQYGARQKMDITDEHFRFHAERVIRKIMEHVNDHPAIIGYQVDNETKHYDTAGDNVQKAFVASMKEKFTLEALNSAFGLDYWSNRINNWDDFPSTVGSINASLNSEFSKFQRKLVTDFLAWQTGIIKGYAKTNQFVTHNFDLDWRGYSYGIQTDVNHFDAAKVLDIAGIDIYHPTQDHLTGIEISFAGDLARSMKGGKNYFVMETEAQGFPKWVPYPGQLKLQAFSHLASGANMVAYWHWHSIHNSAETYWKGLLSHDFQPNPTYNEAKTIGKDFQKLSNKLVNLKKKNDVALLFSNEAQTAFNNFEFVFNTKYNDVLRPYYDALYKMNVGVDFIDPSVNDFSGYKLIIIPVLYAAPDELLERLNAFVANGGNVVYSFQSGSSDENVKVRSSIQPGIINKACGITYSQFTVPENVSLKDDPYNVGTENKIHTFMELIKPTTAKVLAYYDHPVWKEYAAITENKYGKGLATYLGAMTSDALLEEVLKDVVKKTGLWDVKQNLKFPIITKDGINAEGKTIRYIMNYSDKAVEIKYPFSRGTELLNNQKFTNGELITLEPWSVKIVEMEGK